MCFLLALSAVGQLGWQDATLWLAASCKFMNIIVHAHFYANEAYNSCASVAGFVVAFYGRYNMILLQLARCNLQVS